MLTPVAVDSGVDASLTVAPTVPDDESVTFAVIIAAAEGWSETLFEESPQATRNAVPTMSARIHATIRCARIVVLLHVFMVPHRFLFTALLGSS